MNWIFYGLFFVGLGLYRLNRERRLRRELHTHRCCKCGTAWQHDGSPRTDAEQIAAHTCPTCGREQWRIDDTPPPAAVPLEPRPGPGQAPADALEPPKKGDA